jgi:hypothetical protein
VATGGRDAIAWQTVGLTAGHADARKRVRTQPSRTRCWCETHDRLVCCGHDGAGERPSVGRHAALGKFVGLDGTAVAVGRVSAPGTRNSGLAEASVRCGTKTRQADVGLVIRSRRLRLAGLLLACLGLSPLRLRRLGLKDRAGAHVRAV